LQQNDLLPFAFLEYLELEFQWDIDLDRPGWMAIGHFDNDLRFSGAFYAVAHRYLAQIVRNELQVHLQYTHSWLAVERFDQIDALLFTTGRELELTEFCKAKQNRELIESAISFLTENQYLANHPSFVPRKTLQWLVSEQIVQAVDLEQPEPNQPQITEHTGFKFPIVSILFLVYFFIKGVIYVVQDSNSNSNFSRPTSSRSGSSEYFDIYADSRATIKLYRKAAEQGDAKAQVNLGFMYGKGKGVPQDYAEAVKWYRKAADQGYASAQFNLGTMYDQGEGVPQDYAEAYVWSSLAVASGKDAIQTRDEAAEKLSPADLSAAQKRADKLLEEIQQKKAAKE
jgi:hypothetical protein